ncbi:MAG: bifunctional DNA-formamidopyrimidine glycosylase/DNA-(apurinic or apyrimidinic site) lyase [Verrucomicrobia bacterium]|nr:bifunctional DNA-formamidopyrimidine glycosylase/DNA-(apurinic or apyrimidinic site) lyase [Verrucomicrobiota bacterium]
MPELPEVETIVQHLRTCGIIGKSIEKVSVLSADCIASGSPTRFKKLAAGARIKHISRRGKWISLSLDAGTILVHLRMSGSLRVLGEDEELDPYDRLVLELTGGKRLAFRDIRKFGRAYLVQDPEEVLGNLGPEPMSGELTEKSFHEMLTTRQRQLKPLLMDQTFLAGMGNIYTDEALWEARLHPARRSELISPTESRRLFLSIRKVLEAGIRNQGTSLGDGLANYISAQGEPGRNQIHLKAYGREGLPCPRCKTPIEKIVVNQRGTHFCPTCQQLR